jgi:hypothetical protein
MTEATEIAKLRLFLKMVAVVEANRRLPNLGLDPLPDIDFNIRCGNTLVGYASEDEVVRGSSADMFTQAEFRKKVELELEKVSMAYNHFRTQQLADADDRIAFKTAKNELSSRLSELTNMLDHQLFSASGRPDFDDWEASHQPFHWIAEYYQIIQGNGGFDVIIGNPPYVTFTDNSLPYAPKNYKTYITKNLFALVAERCISLSSKLSMIGYIIPLSGMSISGFESLQKLIYNGYFSWSSYYSGDRNPSELFTGVKIRAGIYIGHRSQGDACKYVTKYIKYYSIERDYLFSKIDYIKCINTISAPKLHSLVGRSVIEKINNQNKKLSSEFNAESCFYYHAAPISWNKALNDLLYLENHGLNIADSYKKKSISKKYRDFAFLLINSSLFFYYWIAYSDCYNLTQIYLSNIGVPILNDNVLELHELAEKLNMDLIKHIQIAEYSYKNRGNVTFAQFFPKKSKPIIDEIDKVLAKHYGFTEEELDFIINYDIKYRMGSELNSEEE